MGIIIQIIVSSFDDSVYDRNIVGLNYRYKNANFNVFMCVFKSCYFAGDIC